MSPPSSLDKTLPARTHRKRTLALAALVSVVALGLWLARSIGGGASTLTTNAARAPLHHEQSTGAPQTVPSATLPSAAVPDPVVEKKSSLHTPASTGTPHASTQVARERAAAHGAVKEQGSSQAKDRLHSASAVPVAAPVVSSGLSPATGNCNPPFYFDHKKKIFKPECI